MKERNIIGKDKKKVLDGQVTAYTMLASANSTGPVTLLFRVKPE